MTTATAKNALFGAIKRGVVAVLFFMAVGFDDSTHGHLDFCQKMKIYLPSALSA